MIWSLFETGKSQQKMRTNETKEASINCIPHSNDGSRKWHILVGEWDLRRAFFPVTSVISLKLPSYLCTNVNQNWGLLISFNHLENPSKWILHPDQGNLDTKGMQGPVPWEHGKELTLSAWRRWKQKGKEIQREERKPLNLPNI